MRVDDAPGEAVVEHQVLLTMRNRPSNRLGDVETRSHVRDLVAKSADAFEHSLLTDKVCGEQPDRRLEEHA